MESPNKIATYTIEKCPKKFPKKDPGYPDPVNIKTIVDEEGNITDLKSTDCGRYFGFNGKCEGVELCVLEDIEKIIELGVPKTE